MRIKRFNESKRFMPDPSVIKMYASRIIPFYITGELKCDDKLLDEWLEMNKSTQKDKNENVVCDLEIIAIKQVLSDPLSQTGYTQLMDDVDKKFYKLEKFIRDTLRK